MKTLFNILILLIYSISLIHSQKLNLLDSKGFKQGYWKNYEIDTTRVYGFTLITKDLIHKNASHFYRVKCILISEGYYINNEKEKEWKFYDRYDKLKYINNKFTKTIYKGDSSEFDVTYYQGPMIKEITFKNDTINGTYKSYYKNGYLKSIVQYKSDALLDSIILYYDNGNVQYKGNLIEGKECFQGFEYYENGGIKGLKKWTIKYIINEWINK